ncbi:MULTISPECIES: response regulator transcription factor [Maribacter]|uniref:Response regulator transcription factor n=1 Tax=Maribacter flavus TaxID=1658664 RepID=A0ABU7IIW5_9FLAO|nr:MULTISPECIES: response regulator transcription factor [Maribacter]MDC6405826.1 response regulator transcription factor [Maribacter sp. PR66]MEE1972922.1 response regulator transcription factor [Maribacter flavus]
MPKNILVIEDEHNVAIFIKQGLQDAGYGTLLAYDGHTAFELLNQNTVDLVILDIILPGMDGREIAREIKKRGESAPPILMLTALGTTENIVQGLDSGADDYLVKPFKFTELLARIRALTRRNKVGMKIGHKLIIQDLELDSNAKLVKRAGSEIKLTTTEFRLLEFLMKNKNIVSSRIDILENVWDINFNMATNVVDVYINYLRNKIDKDFDNKLIHTVIGMGYVIRE